MVRIYVNISLCMSLYNIMMRPRGSFKRFNSSKRCSQPVKPEERSLGVLDPGGGGGDSWYYMMGEGWGRCHGTCKIMGHIESKIKNLKGIFTGTFVIDYLGTKRDIIHFLYYCCKYILQYFLFDQTHIKPL